MSFWKGVWKSLGSKHKIRRHHPQTWETGDSDGDHYLSPASAARWVGGNSYPPGVQGGWITIQTPHGPEDWETPFRQFPFPFVCLLKTLFRVSSRKLASSILQPPRKKQLFLPETKVEEMVFVASQTLLNEWQPTSVCDLLGEAPDVGAVHGTVGCSASPFPTPPRRA